jgi:hypothetical protein
MVERWENRVERSLRPKYSQAFFQGLAGIAHMFENVIRDDDVEGICREWQAFATAGQEGCGDTVQGGERARL